MSQIICPISDNRWYMVCTNEGEIKGTIMVGSAYAIFQTEKEAKEYILAKGLRAIAYIERM